MMSDEAAEKASHAPSTTVQKSHAIDATPSPRPLGSMATQLTG